MSITEYCSALFYKEIMPTLTEEQNKNRFEAACPEPRVWITAGSRKNILNGRPKTCCLIKQATVRSAA